MARKYLTLVFLLLLAPAAHADALWASGTHNNDTPGAVTAMTSGEVAVPGSLYVPSQSGIFALVFRADGDLVLYQAGNAIWETHTGPATKLTMQTDGNLSIYNGDTWLWSTGTNGNDGATLSLQNDGNLVIYSGRSLPPLPPPCAGACLDILRYLTQAQCPDGSIPTNCASPSPRKVTDPIKWQARDYGTPGGFLAEHSSLGTDGKTVYVNWSFAPFGFFNSANGDGGEVYQAADGHTWKVLITEDGGTLPAPPETYALQYFTGEGCGNLNGVDGTGWILFDANNMPTGSWESSVAYANESINSYKCPTSYNAAYTRWRKEDISLPFSLDGSTPLKNLTVSCIIYEHYDGDTIQNAVKMEQSAWCKDLGRVWFASYKPVSSPFDLGYRLPAKLWPAPPERPDFKLFDARLQTNIVTITSACPLRQVDLGWPPASFTPP